MLWKFKEFIILWGLWFSVHQSIFGQKRGMTLSFLSKSGIQGLIDVQCLKIKLLCLCQNLPETVLLIENFIFLSSSGKYFQAFRHSQKSFQLPNQKSFHLFLCRTERFFGFLRTRPKFSPSRKISWSIGNTGQKKSFWNDFTSSEILCKSSNTIK